MSLLARRRTENVINAKEEAAAGFDRVDIGCSVIVLKPLLSNNGMEVWFPQLSATSQQAVFAALRGRSM